MKRSIFIALWFGFPLAAGQITLSNGDRLTGALVHSDEKTVTFKADLAGVVTIAWDAVATISSPQPLHVSLRDGRVLVGPVETENGRFVVFTSNAGKIDTAKADVVSIRSAEDQAAHDAEVARYSHPRIIDLWAGFLDLGASLSQGNARTTNINVTANAIRDTRRRKLELSFTSLYASDKTSGTSRVTANAIRGGFRYGMNVSPKVLAFVASDFEYDEFQKLDLRVSPALGIGWIAVKTERTLLNVLGGASLNREFFASGLNRTSGEALIGEEYNLKASKLFGINEKFTIYPNVTRAGDYRMNFDFSAVTTLRKWLAWHLSVSDRFLSNPLPDLKRNDVLFTSGIRLSFAR